jgi:hypothetical protein
MNGLMLLGQAKLAYISQKDSGEHPMESESSSASATDHEKKKSHLKEEELGIDSATSKVK